MTPPPSLLDLFIVFMRAALELVSAILVLCLPIVARWIARKIADLVAHYQLQGFARIAVLAAEQRAVAGFIKDKKREALVFVRTALAERGVKLPLQEIDAAIEAALYAEINKWKNTQEEKAGGQNA